MATENKLWTPPLSPKDQKRLTRLRNSVLLQRMYQRTGFAGKTLWDWLQLLGVLAIPLVVAGATLLFSIQQAHLADVQHQNDIKIAQDSRRNDLKIADNQQQEATLKAYLDDMTTLLLDKKLGSQAVADKFASAEAAVIARAKTLIVLRRLTDPQRKAIVVQFLYKAHLIGYLSCDICPVAPAVIDLSGAHLSGADLSGGAHLSGADLSSADLSGADLSGGADLSYAHLSGAYLVGADLSGAHLSYADLIGTDLSGADLSGAYLVGADLSGTDLSYAHLSGAYLSYADLGGAHLIGAHLSGAYLIGAHLSYADLIGTDLSDAHLSGAYLVGVDLSYANLSSADLSGASLTQQQLDQVNSCKNASLPKGVTCHEIP